MSRQLNLAVKVAVLGEIHFRARVRIPGWLCLTLTTEICMTLCASPYLVRASRTVQFVRIKEEIHFRTRVQIPERTIFDSHN